jgi:hypothetical protein
MSDETVVAIARIPLARSPLRMLVPPTVLLLAGGLAAGAGWLLGGWAGIGLLVGGALVAALALYLAAVILTVRLEVEVSTLRLRHLGRDQRFVLARGAVTRVPLIGAGAARLRPRFGALGWGLGPARLRGREPIHVVRLAPTDSVILVPTDAGRVAVAPASEQQLISALAAAARVQHRLEQVAAQAQALPRPRTVVERPRPAMRQPEPERGRVLTGIERVLLEQRLAAERAAALAAAEEERKRAEEAAALAAERPAAAEADERPARALRIPRPALALPRPQFRLPRVSGIPQERAAGYLVATLPLLAATLLWAAASFTGRLELPLSEARLVGLTLALAGPAAALGALAARAWFPRLVGLVAATSLCVLVLAGRALLA